MPLEHRIKLKYLSILWAGRKKEWIKGKREKTTKKEGTHIFILHKEEIIRHRPVLNKIK